MVYFLIDNHFIENDYKYNSGFFTEMNLLAINLDYNIENIPYYKNSKYFYRNLLQHKKLNIEILNQYVYKPEISNNQISYNYFNVKKKKGYTQLPHWGCERNEGTPCVVFGIHFD